MSVFDELDGADLDNRWTACVALTTEIWGRGLLGCSCQAERAEWMGRTTDYFDQVRDAFLAGQVSTVEEIASDMHVSRPSHNAFRCDYNG
jgi:hypothetical protein